MSPELEAALWAALLMPACTTDPGAAETGTTGTADPTSVATTGHGEHTTGGEPTGELTSEHGSTGAATSATTSATTSGESDSGSETGEPPPPDDDKPPPAVRGATLPYWEYEAEAASFDGVLLGPSRAFGDVAAESSGRQAVRLEATGQRVTFTSEHHANTIVVRFAIPDAPAGGGITATLGLYVDGVRTQSLPLTSRFSWVYGGESDSETNTPGPGAHHFYDEVRAFIGDVPPGATISLQKDAQDVAEYYVVDLIDLERVDPPLVRPADALSITEFGAVADDGLDDGSAIQQAIDAGEAMGRTVWIPEGTFDSAQAPLLVSGVTVRGAGMWYSTLHGPFARFDLSGNDNRFHDFAILGETDARHDDLEENGFNDGAGAGSRLENLWIEHTKVGYWVGKNAALPPDSKPTDGLVIRGVRVRNTFADGVNFCNGTSNSVVEQSHFRNTGDDALAAWSPNFDGPPGENNAFRFNTVQSPWRANCFAVYGGTDMRVEDNLCADVVIYPGILVSSGFSSHPFAGTTTIQRNTLTRAGGPMYDQQHGALKVLAEQSPITGVVFRDMRIEGSTFSGLHIQGPHPISGLVLADLEIEGSGTVGILVNDNAHGDAQVDAVVVTGGPGLQNDAPDAWNFNKGAGNRGW